MKRITIIQSAFSLLLVCSTAAMGQVKEIKKYAIERRKNFEKSYAISAADKIDLTGHFGSITVSTWGKNEVKLTAEVIVTAQTESWAEAVVNNIKLLDLKTPGSIIFTVENDVAIYKDKNSRQTAEVNMVLHLPVNNPLKLHNSFGPVIIPDYNGRVDIFSEFGSLTAGKLPNAGTIGVSYGKAKIKSLANADALFSFSEIEIDNLTGSNRLNIEFCGPSRITVGKDAKLVDITESYSTLNIKPAAGLQATYTVNTSYTVFKNRTGTKLLRTNDPPEYGPDQQKEYTGKSGNGECAVKIKSQFGKIILGEATETEMESQKEKKGKALGEDEER